MSETINFDQFSFTYDKWFLNKLKDLKKELQIFATNQSKAKSRCFGPSLDDINKLNHFEKQHLILRIKLFIKAIEGYERKRITNNNQGEQVSNFSQTSQPNSVNSNNSDTQIYVDSSDSSDNNFHCNHYHIDNDTNQSNVELTLSQARIESFKILNFCQQYVISNGFNDFCASNFTDLNENLDLNCNNDRNDWCNDCFNESYVQSCNDCCFYDENACYCNSCTACMDCMDCQQNDSQLVPQLAYSQYFTQHLAQSMTNDKTGDLDLKIVNRHKWSNTNYNIVTGVTLKDLPQNKVRTQTKRQKQIKFVLEKILGLIEKDIYCTKRDLYYQNVLLFGSSQRIVDEIVDDLACSLRASRHKLHIVSSTRGLVFGHLKFQNTNGMLTNCLNSPNGVNIPNDTERISLVQSNAAFVLIIEKDATFQQLIDLKIHKRYPLIMVTGHGYPDMNTRAFIQILWNSFNIPIFGLVDGDAHGLEILCTFRHGSLALSYESPNLVVPAIKWLGILPTDIGDFRLSREVRIPLTKNDKKKIEDLKQRKYMIENVAWSKQLDVLLEIGSKVEIQSLAQHSPTFLLDVYLPAKIRYGKWI